MAKSDYVAAEPEKLDEILRQAESRLGSQLAMAIAADQRAMAFAGILAAIAIGLLAFGTERGFSAAVVTMIVVLAAGTFSAALAAQPIEWGVYGTSPTDWIEDIAEGKDDLLSGKAALADYYGDKIDQNGIRLTRNAWLIRTALFSAAGAVPAGAVAALVAAST